MVHTQTRNASSLSETHLKNKTKQKPKLENISENQSLKEGYTDKAGLWFLPVLPLAASANSHEHGFPAPQMLLKGLLAAQANPLPYFKRNANS